MIMAAPNMSGEAALRARLGVGARHDAPGAPSEGLRLARHGMAFFARQLNGLSDADLGQPSRIPSWQRAHVVAHVSLEARTQALALAALRGQLPEDDFGWTPDLDLTASLPTRALRHLYEHAHVHINVEWRDLTTAQWGQPVTMETGEAATASDLPLHHAALLWWGAVALNTGAAANEIPRGLYLPPGQLHAMATLPADTIPAPAG